MVYTMAPILLCIIAMHMWAGLRKIGVLFLSVIWVPAFAAILMDSSGSLNPDPPNSESNAEVQQELFPLTEIPTPSPSLLLPSEPAPLVSLKVWHELRGKVLDDFGSRISPEFHIPSGVRERTEFWFDIYARYGEAHHVIHHVLYPWIIFKVVDTTELLEHGKGPLWLRRDQGDKLARAQSEQIRVALRKLAKRTNYNHLVGQERELYDLLLPLKGSRQRVFRVAAASVRSQLGQKDFFARGLVNSSRYLPYMEEEFKRLGLPTELTRMPFVESSFNEEARSKVGASGIWQIMPRTGQQYMIVSAQIDERNAPLKATRTAGRLLHSYNHALKSWPLTITSYNHGIGNIQKAIRMAKSADISEIIARYHDGDFKFASSNFYTCFLAALYAEKYNELIFKEAPREPLQEFTVLRLTNKTRVKYLRKVTGLAEKDLLRLNLDLKSALHENGFLPRGYLLHLPPSYRDHVTPQIGTQEKLAKITTALSG